MKKLHFYVIILLFVLAVRANAANDGNWQKITNAFYTLEVPFDWRPNEGSPEMIPGERVTRDFVIRYLAWWKPVSYKERDKTIGLDIQSYSRLGSHPTSIPEIESLIFFKYITKEITHDSKTKKIYSVLKASKEIDGSSTNYRSFYLLSEKKGQVHTLCVSVVDDYYKGSPEIQQIVKKIIDSFSLN